MVPKQNQLPGAPSTEAKPHSYPSAKWRKKQAAKVPTCDPAEGVKKKDKENKGKDGGGEEPAERAGENLEKVWGGETRLYRTLPGTS